LISGVRSASFADIALLAEIHRASFGAGQAWPSHVIGTHLLMPGGFGLVHPAGGMALARVVLDEAEVLTLAVVPGSRGRGIGRALVDALIADTCKAGACTCFLEVSKANERAYRLYVRAGFEAVGIRRGYYEDGTDAVVMKANSR